MTKRGVIRCVLSVLLIAYLAVALSFASRYAAAEPYKALLINVDQSHAAKAFVTADDIDHELDGLSHRIRQMRADSVNTLAIERAIMSMDNIEQANCVVLNNGMVRLDVMPLVPVARVFDNGSGTNYYINRAGKQMRASTRYRMDVPVIVGTFGSKVSPTSVLPVLDYIHSRPELESLVSSIKVLPNGDIVLIPMVKGHVVNFGDSTNIENKFKRLSIFYRDVMPVKGWEYYDTISVKWAQQVVAKKHGYRPPAASTSDDPEVYIDDPGTMLDNSTNP